MGFQISKDCFYACLQNRDLMQGHFKKVNFKTDKRGY